MLFFWKSIKLIILSNLLVGITLSPATEWVTAVYKGWGFGDPLVKTLHCLHALTPYAINLSLCSINANTLLLFLPITQLAFHWIRHIPRNRNGKYFLAMIFLLGSIFYLYLQIPLYLRSLNRICSTKTVFRFK